MKRKAWIGVALLLVGVILIPLPVHIAITGLTI